MAKLSYHYPLSIRIWHAINALCILLLILTGISMYYVDPDRILIEFSWAVKIHNVTGVILSFSYLFFLIANAVSKNRKYYKMPLKGLMNRLVKQSGYYAFGMFKGEKKPFPLTEERKFNPLQKLFYVLAMYVGVPLVIISGLGLLFPESVIKALFGVSGILITDVLHVAMGFFISLFLVIHIYVSTIGHTKSANFIAIISGYGWIEETENETKSEE
ncbi:MAG: cytochrome b/b6 domain-containing protein [Bacteroidales bacterium]|nr:cytochrome b/b6 domain-containing protein [Bacteroidales bacterium]